MRKLAFLSAITILMSGCMVGPKYKRPLVNAPTDYRNAMPAEAASTPAAPPSSLGNENGWQVYQDPVLVQLIHTALKQNYNVRIAATNVLEAQAQLGITHSDQFPTASVGADVYSQQNAKVTSLFPASPIKSTRAN